MHLNFEEKKIRNNAILTFKLDRINIYNNAKLISIAINDFYAFLARTHKFSKNSINFQYIEFDFPFFLLYLTVSLTLIFMLLWEYNIYERMFSFSYTI